MPRLEPNQRRDLSPTVATPEQRSAADAALLLAALGLEAADGAWRGPTVAAPEIT
jgi:hypothetical protein